MRGLLDLIPDYVLSLTNPPRVYFTPTDQLHRP
jgi:hypothetical protein